jgi:hypothetical protein
MAGEHFFDGFIKDYRKEEAKKIIEEIVAGLNDGKLVSIQEIKDKLKEYTP